MLYSAAITASDPPIYTDNHTSDIDYHSTLVLSRLDYSNIVLADIPAYLVHHLQSVLNATARLVYHLKCSLTTSLILSSVSIGCECQSVSRTKSRY